MDTVPYDLPLGDRVTFDVEGRLEFTDAMCAMFAGGPSQTVDGRVLVTEQRLVFCPVVGQPHPQRVDLVRDPSWAVERIQRRWLGLVSRGAPVVQVSFRMGHRDLVLAFHVPDPDALVNALGQTPPAAEAARTLLADALTAGVRERGRYTSVLQALSFPGGFWHTEALEDLVDVVVASFADLDLDLDEAWLQTLDLDVEPLMGPEDYETGPGSEAWARKHQIARICVAANEAIEAIEVIGVIGGSRRFYAFAEDLPGWEFDEPVWLLLTEDERQRLLSLGIVREPATKHPIA